jgi:hypothetical protein
VSSQPVYRLEGQRDLADCNHDVTPGSDELGVHDAGVSRCGRMVASGPPDSGCRRRNNTDTGLRTAVKTRAMGAARAV